MEEDLDKQRDQKMQDMIFPIQNEQVEQNKPQVDSNEIKDRILTLKLMFDDSTKLRQQRDFLNNQGQNVMTNPAASHEDLGMVK